MRIRSPKDFSSGLLFIAVAVFFIALGAAIITPGDGPSMLVLAAPLVVLYFLSVLVATALWKVRGHGRAKDAEGA